MRVVCGYHVRSITAATWTIIQTLFHLAWAIPGYYAYLCSVVPSHYLIVFVYLTYFYKKSCGEVHLDDERIFVIKDLKTNYSNSSISRRNFVKAGDYSLYEILEEVLREGKFSEEGSAAYRTSVYIKIFIVTDFIWIVTAILLIVGSLMAVRKHWAVILYAPYVVCTGVISIIDVIAAVHFGFDLLTIKSFTTWLKFVGVTNSQDFEHLNGSLGWIGPAIPTIILIVLCLRLFVFWVLNICVFYGSVSLTAESYAKVEPTSPSGSGRTSRISSSTIQGANELRLNSSEARIRKWQQFYGASSAEASTSTISTINEVDHNSNSRSSIIAHSARKKVVVSEPIEKSTVNRKTSNESSKYYDASSFPWSYGKLPENRYSRPSSSEDDSRIASTAL
ncbi:uncharacterized protein LOC109594596 [Aethina tumida]|uniref:uncharacterized protein LOC109594596 n=1 Tax=Aethina tumida TaxID=116153 RepID=UPI00096B4A87|nr:uncharacterized protein LOC109594596 [Aethina tumida]